MFCPSAVYDITKDCTAQNIHKIPFHVIESRIGNAGITAKHRSKVLIPYLGGLDARPEDRDMSVVCSRLDKK